MPTATALYEGDGNYDRETGQYQITRYYLCDGFSGTPDLPDDALELVHQEASDSATFPESIDITSCRRVGQASGVTVTLFSVGRELSERVHPNKAIMAVHYEGHEIGVVSWRMDIATKSKLERFDLNDLPIGEGSPPEGTNKFVPEISMTVVKNAVYTDFTVLRDASIYLVGKVNEAKWKPNFYDFQPADGQTNYFLEGAWLYLGAEINANRDNTYTFTHEFLLDPRNQPMHYYVWQYADGGGIQSVEIPEDSGDYVTKVDPNRSANQLSQIYYVAPANTETGTSNFASLDL